MTSACSCRYVSHECDVIAFESLPSDDTGMHSAVLCENDERGAFPPNTLFRLKKIHAPGTWAAPGGHYPQQRLLIMTATYRAPSAGIEQGEQVCPPVALIACVCL